MALDKENKSFYYNLGRAVAVVELMNGVELVRQVNDNAAQKLSYELREALKKQNHNLIQELVEPADIVLKEELPSKVLEPEQGNVYWVGYYHEKSYIDNTYHGIYGKVSTEVVEHTPEIIEASNVMNGIKELKK